MQHTLVFMNKRLLKVSLFPLAVVFTRVANWEIVEENYSVGVNSKVQRIYSFKRKYGKGRKCSGQIQHRQEVDG